MGQRDSQTPTAGRSTTDDARTRLLAGLPVAERPLELAGIDTAVLEGGSRPPIVLLHDPSEHAVKWFRVLPELTSTHRVVAPDLVGHGASGVPDASLDTDRVLAWLRELIEQTCPAPPALVGLILGGGIAARFAVDHSDRIDRLVLVDALGLAPLEPTPPSGQALEAYLADPTAQTHDELWRYCAYDLDRTRTATGQRAVYELMAAFGMAAIPAEDLARIAVPTTLIWGRHDLATPLAVARAASERHAWPLHVIEDSGYDPTIEQPQSFMRVLHVALGRTVTTRPA